MALSKKPERVAGSICEPGENIAFTPNGWKRVIGHMDVFIPSGGPNINVQTSMRVVAIPNTQPVWNVVVDVPVTPSGQGCQAMDIWIGGIDPATVINISAAAPVGLIGGVPLITLTGAHSKFPSQGKFIHIIASFFASNWFILGY